MLPNCSKLLAAVVLLATIPHGPTQSLNEPCTNPLGQPGRCVFLRECQPLLNIYRRGNVPSDESKFFNGSRCSGYFEGKPLLCCFPAPVNSSASLPRAPSDCGLAPNDCGFAPLERIIDEFPWMAYTLCLGEEREEEERDCDQHGCVDVPVEVGIEKVIVHEQYNGTKRGLYNDIVLIRLDRDVGSSDQIDPICLPVEDSVRKMDHTGRMAVASFTETGSDVMLKLTLDVLDHKRCVNVYRMARVMLRDTQQCASGKEGMVTCRGYSGGPLIRAVYGKFYLIGVLNWGASRCGTNGIPALYTNVAMFVDWIENHLG